MEMRDVCSRAMRALADDGAETGEIGSPPLFTELTDAQKIVMGYEAANARRDVYASHRGAISTQFAQLIREGQGVTEARYREALAIRDKAGAMVEMMFADYDGVLVPSAPGEAPEGLGATGDPLFSRMWNLLQLPCVALPFGIGPRGLPVGIQLIGRLHEDAKLLAVAQWAHAVFSGAR
jgi:amidase